MVMFFFVLCIIIPPLWPVAIIIALTSTYRSMKNEEDDVEGLAAEMLEERFEVRYTPKTMEPFGIKQCWDCKRRDTPGVLCRGTYQVRCLECGAIGNWSGT